MVDIYIVRVASTFYSKASKVIVKIGHDAQPTQNCTILLFLRDHDYDLTTNLYYYGILVIIPYTNI